MRRLVPVAAVIAGMSPFAGLAADGPLAAIATIEVERDTATVRLTGKALALTGGLYEAQLKIEKSGTSGRSSTSQGGAFELGEGESATVATVGLSIDPQDVLAAELVLSADGREVARSRLSVGQ